MITVITAVFIVFTAGLIVFTVYDLLERRKEYKNHDRRNNK